MTGNLCYYIPIHGNNKKPVRKEKMMFRTDKNTAAQYARARKHSAIFDISHGGRLVLRGKDHLKFLQGMLTNDVLKPSPGEGVYALMLNNKGRVLADVKLFRKDSETLLDVGAAAEKTARRMNDFKLSYKVEVNRGKNRTLFHLTGHEAPEALSQAVRSDTGKMKRFDHFEASIGGARVWTARVDRTGRVGFDIETAPENAEETFRAFAAMGVSPAGAETFDIMRMEAGIPEYGRDMDESTIAPETGLREAVSFDKGCYVGQEIVARAHWRGRVNRHFSGFVFKGENAPPEGAGILSEEGSSIGRVTSSGFSPSAGPVALGYIRREFKSPGTRIKTETGREGEVRSFPISI